MTTISGVSKPVSTARTTKTKSATGGFAPADTGAAQTTSRTSATAPTETLSALIALQSEDHNGKATGKRRTVAAAQQILSELEALQQALLVGQSNAGLIEAVERAATMRAHAGAPSELLQIYDQIALRARVELAKIGRQADRKAIINI